MLKLSTTAKFNKDLKLCKKRGYDLNTYYIALHQFTTFEIS